MKIHAHIIYIIETFINSIYPLFKRLMSKRVYLFCATGSICFAINVMVFFASIQFLYKPNYSSTHIFQPHIAAWLTAQSISIPIGFYLNYHIVFPTSSLKIRTQFFRFVFTNILNVILSYLIIRFLVEVWDFLPTISLILATVIATFINYFIQSKFVFCKKNN